MHWFAVGLCLLEDFVPMCKSSLTQMELGFQPVGCRTVFGGKIRFYLRGTLAYLAGIRLRFKNLLNSLFAVRGQCLGLSESNLKVRLD